MLLHNIKLLYKWLFVRSQKLETEPVVENTIANLGCKTKEDLMLMTKDSLEAYGRTIGIELDKRRNKDTLVEQLLKQQESLDKKYLVLMTKDNLEAYGRTIGIELDKRKNKDTLIEQLLKQQEQIKR